MIVGVDPGMSGAIVAVSGGDIVACIDMPVVEVRGKRVVDAAGIVSAIGDLDLNEGDMAVLEHVQGVQGTGATSAFSFGRGFGILEGVLAGLGVPHTLVRPQRWTKDLNVSSDKGDHRRAAMRLWPKSRDLFVRVKDDGRADAALLCHWYARGVR
jgi:crossover junction endodeoxyribonuclease RuvC